MKKKKQKIFKKHITYPNTFNFILYFQLTQHSSPTTILPVRPAYSYNPSEELG